MAAKKKPSKKQTGPKKTAGKKVVRKMKPAKKRAVVKKKAAKKLTTKLAKKLPKRPARRRPAVKAKAPGKTVLAGKTVIVPNRGARQPKQTRDRMGFSPERPGPRSGGQSGDLQGLSGVESVNSESVDELLEEGNAFEADVVAGVEEAGNTDENEVRTREVPEDDVPGEYLDKD